MWTIVFYLYLSIALSTNNDCNFDTIQGVSLNENVIFCSRHIFHNSQFKVFCPKIVNGMNFSFFPNDPTKYTLIYTLRRPNISSKDVILTETHTNYTYGTVSEDLITLTNEKDRQILLIKYPSDNILATRNIDSIIFLCAHNDLYYEKMEEIMDHHFIESFFVDGSEDDTYSNISSHGVNMKIGFGIVEITLLGTFVTHGCGSMPTKLFLNEAKFDKISNSYSCEIDILETPNIGFYCDGEVSPNDCFATMHAHELGERYIFTIHHFITYNTGGALRHASYDINELEGNFTGSCVCRNPISGVIKAVITVARRTYQICDITSKLMLNKIKPIIGNWCNMVLHPGDTLVIKYPQLNGYYNDITDEFVNFDGIKDCFVSAFTPHDLSRYYQGLFNINGNNPIMNELRMHDIIGGSALEIDESRMAKGKITVSYHRNKPLALKTNYKTFHFRWDHKHKYIPEIYNEIANIEITLVGTHPYIIGCEAVPSGIFNANNAELHCKNIFTDCIGERLRHCHNYTSLVSIVTDMGGIYCPSGQQLMPPTCGFTSYINANTEMSAWIDVIKVIDRRNVEGLRVLGFQNSQLMEPFTVSCSCVDNDGMETARIVIGKIHVDHIHPARFGHTNDNAIIIPKIFIRYRPSIVGNLLKPEMDPMSLPLTLKVNAVNLLIGHRYWITCPKIKFMTDRTFLRLKGMQIPTASTNTFGNEAVYIPQSLQSNETSSRRYMTSTFIFPLNLEEHFFTLERNQFGSLLDFTPTRYDSVIGTNVDGIKIGFPGSRFGNGDKLDMTITYPESTILVIKDPLKSKIDFTYICGAISNQLGSLRGDGPYSYNDVNDAGTSSNPKDGDLIAVTPLDAWGIVTLTLKATDPFLHGCGVVEPKEEFFRPDTVPIYNVNGDSVGCRINLNKVKKAGFYCPLPYILDPKGCFHNVNVTSKAATVPLTMLFYRKFPDAAMANRTDATAHLVHGTNPQFLFSKILRDKVYNCTYWKESCFGLTAESVIDKALELEYIGGTFGGNRQPCPFICLVLKLLQIQPEIDIIEEYIKNEHYKYLRALGVYYMRLVGSAVQIYEILEPLLADYRKLRFRNNDGEYSIRHMDEFVDDCLRLTTLLDVDLPPIPKRSVLEDSHGLKPRQSVLGDDTKLNSGTSLH
ncbi:bifunctional 6-Cysteine (6-Cys) domain/Pre-mRNA-splicing factor 38/6-Cysteine (6-Cys) domain superfamily [Babesia duncani]|uniref:Bifunctional 6-Cysteine (6-Cys) domain/Pre-mRNA-splicing factor 38/6-Cysteine (6-Cys) domain superfamily n=1 Tax=Babesia duncani TaxID=323732 RepID=A0AAD9PHS9_9APIC|nr:bifunctional 6-Cysteine (6-Cys) domain/Pre-mRNA-splicing factor 38/6-Cysteine (6-Cys) domain superfamily [Babesia duncani]